MRIWGTLEEARQARRRRVTENEKFHGFSDVLFERPPHDKSGPQAFVAHQAPNWVLCPHFHLEDQFQLVVHGTGKLGVHEISPYTVHFSSKETGYGPIISREEGLQYFTLRAVSDHGAFYLPEDRHRMRRGLRKQHFTAKIQEQSVSKTSEGEGINTLAVIGKKEDGLAVWSTRASSGSVVTAPQDVGGRGRFHVVIRGSFAMDEEHLPRLACVFTSSDEPPLVLRALSDESEFVTLQFPIAMDEGSQAANGKLPN